MPSESYLSHTLLKQTYFIIEPGHNLYNGSLKLLSKRSKLQALFITKFDSKQSTGEPVVLCHGLYYVPVIDPRITG